jgi:hypothetical protein
MQLVWGDKKTERGSRLQKQIAEKSTALKTKESNRLHHSNLAQTTTLILTMVKSHLNGWETIAHKDTSQTQHHKRWKDLYDTHDCMTKYN